MALTFISSLSIRSLTSSTSNSKTHPIRLQSFSKPFSTVCEIDSSRRNSRDGSQMQCMGISEGSKNWKGIVSVALAAAAAIGLSSGMPAFADLNKFEAETPGEFGIGSAAQFGSADFRKAVHVNENFRRANFTSADMRESDFSGSTFNGAYLEKAVAYKANFAGSLQVCEWHKSNYRGEHKIKFRLRKQSAKCLWLSLISSVKCSTPEIT